MRKIVTALCLVAASATFAQQTKRIMTVKEKGGAETTYKVANLESVACVDAPSAVMTVVAKDGSTRAWNVDDVERTVFADKQYAELDNQWDLNGEVNAVGSVLAIEQTDSYVFSVYTTENVTRQTENDWDFLVYVPKTSMGKDLDLATSSDVLVYNKAAETYEKGTLKAKFDKFQKNLTLSLDVEKGDDELRCEYTGAFGWTFAEANKMAIVTVDAGEAVVTPILSAFRVQPSAAGEPTNFAFGDVEAATPADMQSGTLAVWVSISAAKLHNGTIDMAKDVDSYTFRLVDYGTRTVYDKVDSGTITTAQSYDGSTYVEMNVVVAGYKFTLSYYGDYADVASLDDMIPMAVAENEYKYYNSDGELSLTRELGTSYVDDYKGNLTFYLIPDGDTKYSSDKVQIKVQQSLVNAGEIQLAEVGEDVVFDIKYNAGGIQLQSYAAGYGYGNMPDNGTLTVSKDENGVYDIKLDITNKYHNSYTTNGGDNTRLVVHYKGTFEAY